jgi:hypothetical protein
MTPTGNAILANPYLDLPDAQIQHSTKSVRLQAHVSIRTVLDGTKPFMLFDAIPINMIAVAAIFLCIVALLFFAKG